MIRLISRTDGRIAITILGIISLLLIVVFMSPVMKVEASHCLPGSALSCVEDVRHTKHNLNLNTDINQTGTTEICVFCHTPHGFKKTGGIANPDGLLQVPLWNRATKASSGVYTPYSGIHFDALGNTAGVPKGVSLACLSCHDGTISFDALINAPGSGGFNSLNLSDLAVNASGTRNPTMTFGGTGVDGTGSMKDANRGDQTVGGGFTGGLADFVGVTGAQGMAPFPNLTQDLSDDHPISMRMPGNAGEDPQFRDVFLNRVTDGADGSKISFVSRYAAVGERIWSADKRDRIRLYPTNGAADLSTYVECASCHNPHTPRTLFLRLPTVSTLDYPAAGTTVNGVTMPAGGLADFSGGGFGTQLVNETTPFTITVNSATGNASDLSHKPNQGSLICLSCHQK